MPKHTATELALFIEAYLRLIWSSSMVSCFPKRATRAMLRPVDHPRRWRSDPQRIARCFGAAACRHFMRPACLSRSLALRDMLRWRGIPAELRVSLSRDDRKRIVGHAWVELDGTVLNDRQELSDSETLIFQQEKANER